MNTTKGYYSLVQFCPDPARAEAANIGVLLFCPDAGFIEARLAKGNDRIRRFFKGQTFDFDRVNFAKQAIARRLKTDRDHFKTLDDLYRFIETRANEVVITPPRPVKVWEPNKDLKRLYADLVGGRQKRDARESFAKRLSEALRRPTLTSRMRYDLEVTVPVVDRRLEIPFAYRNGVLNLVKPQVLSTNEKYATDTAMRLAYEGQMIAKHLVLEGQATKLVVVYGFEDGSAASPTNSPSNVANGVYALVITATEAQCLTGKVIGSSSTASVVIIGETYSFHRLPNAAPGSNGGLPTVDASNYVAGVVGHTPQTGDSYARLGAPAGASIAADIADIAVGGGSATAENQEILIKLVQAQS